MTGRTVGIKVTGDQADITKAGQIIRAALAANGWTVDGQPPSSPAPVLRLVVDNTREAV